METETKTYADLQAGDRFYLSAIERFVTVAGIAPTSSVKFGQVGPDATPILRVTVTDMPKPFGNWIEGAADRAVEVARVTGHRWQIDPEGNGHRARCSCGWQGHKRTYWADARREGDQHHSHEVAR